MRTAFMLILAGVCLGIVGCASQDKAVTADPTPEELPRMPEVRQHYAQGDVKVPGRRQTPRAVLTPDFEEPPLTPEERAAVGEDKPEYEPLLHPYRGHIVGTGVGNWYGGQDVAIGAASRRVAVAPVDTRWVHTYGLDSFTVQIGLPSRIAHRDGITPPPGHVGPWDGLDVGIGFESIIAKPYPDE